MEAVLKNDFVTVSYNSSRALLSLDWNLNTTFLRPLKFQEILQKVVKRVEKLEVKLLLINTTNFDFVIEPRMQTWLSAEFNQRLAKAGLKKMAIVLPEAVFVQVAIEQAVQEIKLQPEIPSFEVLQVDNLAKAEHWLFN
ncbi:MAG TPA: hypothetical protein DCS93_26315 [Microscillaceae bacterium]|nr:hypothetical protein [Microscillaceae bacterium]